MRAMHIAVTTACAMAVALALQGCAPKINTFTVVPGSDVNLVNVEANINTGVGVSVQAPKLRVASLATNPPVFHDVVGGFASVNGTVHQLSGLALPAGQFRVELVQPYSVIFSSNTNTATATQDIAVTPPAGCFFFDGGLEGWTVEGFFEIRTASPADLGTRADLCTGQMPVISASGRNFPAAYTSPIPSAFRSLNVSLNPLINACFTSPVPMPQSGFVAVDLISPDLAGRAGWSGATGFELQARGINLSGAADPPMRLQLLLQDTAGTTFRPQSANGQPLFVSLGAAFAPASFARAGTVLSRVRVRVFVPRLQNPPPETEINIDRICPRAAS